MGCCASQLDENEVFDVTDGPLPSSGNTPLRKKNLSWTSETPMTLSQLQSQRDGFWDTAPVYEGQREVWEGLRTACETTDLVHAQSIVDELRLSVPTGHLSDGCYDERGNRYIIPLYCFVEPTNVVVESIEAEMPAPEYELEDKNYRHIEEASTASKPYVIPVITITEHDSEAAEESLADDTQELTVRLNTGKDVRLRVSPTEDLHSVKRKVCAVENIEPSSVNIRFIYLGKILEDKLIIENTKVSAGGVIQALMVQI
ncbi:hypothetical protein K493DRAFT_266449 [Basidiobolus meristosporus CBS 931.73]|uniref:Ubiquitin-like domain-containing protein n=1 Tax=Basidiobolus meristosporus CBS 931.73 TaxID=1314790 RepID=A0A1Y1XVX5_9FUNG|nr:hypothetical protein K493DRAFT_266449 [Basidiobolus meristosporus CBS 931.73]|eukprot:ORX89910.1 hypothetical protein K493DRAFT_266449 [Basidiobolus meristosporus CBS 931.73]